MKPSRSTICTLSLALAIPQQACTAIGAAIGSSIKRPSAQRETAPGSASGRLVRGNRVVLHLSDGSCVEGVVESVGWRVGSDYETAYRAFQVSSPRGRLLPDLGSAQLLGEGDPWPQSVTFLGLDERGVVVRRRGGAPERIPFQALGSVSVHGETVDASLLRSLAIEARAPLLSEIRLVQPKAHVPVDNIISLERPVMKGLGIQGAGVGLTLDALGVLFVYLALSDLKNADFGFRWPD